MFSANSHKGFRVPGWILGVIFFASCAVVFRLYGIDFSPIIIAFLLTLYAKFLRKVERLPSYLDLAILGVIAILIPILTVITFNLSGYWVAAIGFVMLVTMLFENLELSSLFAFFISFTAASIDGGNFNLSVSLFAASLSAAMLSCRVRRRSQLITAGLIAAVVQFITAMAMEQGKDLTALGEFDRSIIGICVLNGLISAVVVSGILTVFEYVFKVVTSISLLELSDFNHPALRRLVLEAPGTYQHSLVVANLSEAAAEAIGANSLLVRVGAYYHDIGKVVKPEYFAENQGLHQDVHRDLKPSMSKLIIVNHVKDGVELARKYHLNPRIIDFITQHHGTSLVYYFYHLAKELEPEVEHEAEYRYPGPKPQSREIAMVSLADTIEAVSRTLEEPTPARIEEMVREVVRKKFMEGELDESGLTLKDLEKITQSFIRMLNAIFHTRVNYPKEGDNE